MSTRAHLLPAHLWFQFYKMVAYEASSHVPLVMAGPGITFRGGVKQLTSAVDLMPTVLELTGTHTSAPLDGTSLVPMLQHGHAPDHVRTQRWYMRTSHPCSGTAT